MKIEKSYTLTPEVEKEVKEYLEKMNEQYKDINHIDCSCNLSDEDYKNFIEPFDKELEE